MKTKLEMAHEWMMKHDDGSMSVEVVVFKAWQYADAMQAEADKRGEEEIDRWSDELSNILKLSKFKPLELQPDSKEWQPDWSQAPDNAMYWAMDGCGQCNWYEREPEVCGSQWDFGCVMEQADTGYDYQGDWRNSLRKRPQ